MDSRSELCNDFVSKDDKKANSEVLSNSKTELASPNEKFVISEMPEDMDLNLFIPVYIAAVETPYKFWFVPQSDEHLRKACKRDEEIKCCSSTLEVMTLYLGCACIMFGKN